MEIKTMMFNQWEYTVRLNILTETGSINFEYDVSMTSDPQYNTIFVSLKFNNFDCHLFYSNDWIEIIKYTNTHFTWKPLKKTKHQNRTAVFITIFL